MKDFSMNYQNVLCVIFNMSTRLFVGVRPEHEVSEAKFNENIW
jgi:hypothetical protein